MKTPALLNLRGWLRRHFGKLFAAALLLAGTAVGGPRLLWGPEAVVQTVVQRDFVQTIVASGRVETPHRVALGVQVAGTVAAPPAYLRQDMTVSMDIEVARRPSAVLVPTDAVRDAFGPSPWVWKVEHGRLARQAIVPGVRTAAWTEVRQGLSAGDTVLPASVQAASEGQRVRATTRALAS